MQVHTSTVDRWRREGKVPVIVIGRVIRFELSAVLKAVTRDANRPKKSQA